MRTSGLHYITTHVTVNQKGSRPPPSRTVAWRPVKGGRGWTWLNTGSTGLRAAVWLSPGTTAFFTPPPRWQGSSSVPRRGGWRARPGLACANRGLVAEATEAATVHVTWRLFSLGKVSRPALHKKSVLLLVRRHLIKAFEFITISCVL